jgi:hypothetical protein
MKPFIAGPFFVLTMGFFSGLHFAGGETITGVIALIIALVAASYVFVQWDKAVKPSMKITYAWSCKDCMKFEVESSDEELLERVKREHLSKHFEDPNWLKS